MPPASDYYDDGGVEADPQPDKADGHNEEEHGDSDTAMLPKSIFKGDVKPGDYIRLCVDKVDENDVLVHRDEGSGKEEKNEEEPMAEAPESPAADSGSMSSMMSDD